MDAQAHLLDGEVRRRGHDLHAGGERDGAEGAVRRDGDVVGLRHRGDAPQLGHAADVGDVRLQDIDGAGFEEGPHVPAAVEALAEGDGDGGLRGQGGDAGDVLGAGGEGGVRS